MVVSTFSLSDKDGRERFFEKNFLLANVKSDTVFGMLFLTMSNANINFQAQNLQWRSYTTRDILLTIRQVKLIGRKEFVVAALDLKYKVFVVHVAVLSVDSGDKVHLSRKAQIAYLKVDKAATEIPNEYADFADVFSSKLAAELLEHGISNHVIELIDNWQPLYSPIYSLGPMKLGH